MHNWYNILRLPRPMTGIEHLQLIVNDVVRDMQSLRYKFAYESILCKIDCSLPDLKYCHVVGATHSRPLNIPRLSKRGWTALGSPASVSNGFESYAAQLQAHSTNARFEFFFARTGVDVVGRWPAAFGVSAPAPLIELVDCYGDEVKSAQAKQLRILQDCYIEFPYCNRAQFFHSVFNTAIGPNGTALPENV